MLVAAELASLVINESVDEQQIVLKELEGDRSLTLYVGIFEALALDVALKNKAGPRPLTHTLCYQALAAVGANVSRVTIHSQCEDIFFASLELQSEHGLIEVDARPSDALALALISESPVFVESDLLEEEP